MVPEIYARWRELVANYQVGDKILEIGAVPTSDSLLNLEAFKSCSTLLGINLDGGGSYQIGSSSLRNSYEIIKGNTNHMDCFENDYFDTVVSNSVMEHDNFFWKTMGEIRRGHEKCWIGHDGVARI